MIVNCYRPRNVHKSQVLTLWSSSASILRANSSCGRSTSYSAAITDWRADGDALSRSSIAHSVLRRRKPFTCSSTASTVAAAAAIETRDYRVFPFDERVQATVVTASPARRHASVRYAPQSNHIRPTTLVRSICTIYAAYAGDGACRRPRE